MLNPNELNHEYFEELCSLAVIGRVTAGEFELLKTHLQTCLSCRSCLADFNEIAHEHLPLLDSGEEVYSESGNVTFHDASYKHRFVQRVAEEGIVFSGESERKADDLKGRHWHHLPSYSLAMENRPYCRRGFAVIWGPLLHDEKSDSGIAERERYFPAGDIEAQRWHYFRGG